MKKLITILIFLLVLIPLFALSYDDNEYQRKSRAYMELATKAYDEGDYDAAIEYSKLAESYAQQSSEFIQRMLAKTEAEQEMNKARTRFTWAKANGAEEKYPDAYKTAEEALNAGSIAFDNENYDVAVVCAQRVMDALSVVEGKDNTGLAELPSQYRIRTWRGERDCLWNIAAKKEVYGNIISENVKRKTAIELEEHSDKIKGLYVITNSNRTYLRGSEASHIIRIYIKNK